MTALYRDQEGFNCDGQPTRAQQELDAERLAAELEALGGIPAAPTILIPPSGEADENRDEDDDDDQVARPGTTQGQGVGPALGDPRQPLPSSGQPRR